MKLLQYKSLSWHHSRYRTVFLRQKDVMLLGRDVTHHVRSAGPVCVAGAVCCRPVGVVVAVAVLPAPLPLVYHQVDGHLALQTTDITVTEIITKFMDLKKKQKQVKM